MVLKSELNKGWKCLLRNKNNGFSSGGNMTYFSFLRGGGAGKGL